MKQITVKWEIEPGYGKGKAMRVIESDHRLFQVGSRFDFSNVHQATNEAYQVLILPMDCGENV